jgi:hypothetical protein
MLKEGKKIGLGSSERSRRGPAERCRMISPKQGKSSE